MAIRFLLKWELRILSRFAFRMTNRLVIAVRVFGGHLCKAEAPTEPAGETAVRRVAIRFSPLGYYGFFRAPHSE